MPISSGNSIAILAPTDKPNLIGKMIASGLPLTGWNGIKLNRPMSKCFMTGAVRRDTQMVQFGNGAALTASTSYVGWLPIVRASLVTGIYLIIGTAPTAANSLLTVTYNGVSLLSGANYTVNSTTPVGQLISLPLSTTAAFVDNATSVIPAAEASGLPYLTPTNGINGAPYPILATYAEGATTVHSTNVALLLEFEPDDFLG